MPKGNWSEFHNPPTTKFYSAKPLSEKSEQRVRVQSTRSGKKGKTVTVISGLELDDAQARTLLKSLKASCGTGGTVKGDVLELQGDQVTSVIELLQREGYRPKRAGG